MKPSLIQRIFAGNWPLWVMLTVGTLGFATYMARYHLSLAFPPLDSAEQFVLFSFFLGISAVIGFLITFVLTPCILSPIYRVHCLNNGAPYQPGDTVRILAGRHKGRIVLVYEVWDERGQVRVELGEMERKKVTDVFSEFEVCRETPVA